MLRIDLAKQTLTPVRSGSGSLQLPGLDRPERARRARSPVVVPRADLHRVRLKIGAGCPLNCVFIGRRPSGEIYSAELAAAQPDRDWILTRILWLSGLEPGRNRGGAVDTLRRFIYIHGCPDSEPMGVARSHGCIRMRNRDLLELFERVDNGARVEIVESA